jgi:FKBP-type peptidyl-prolyl cis-trans isomerase FklB
MKKLWIAGLVLFSVSVNAQKKSIPKKPTGTGTARPLKNLTDSASYAIGLSVANFYKQQGFKNLNTSLIAKACNDVLTNGKTLLNETDANEAIMYYINPTLRKNIDEGKTFLAKNRTRSGIRTTASGIQYEVLKDAQGARPVATDTVVVNYVGTLINGTEFDNSARQGKPIEFPLNRVIKGWTEGLQLMPVGSKYKFYIPQQLAYGMNDQGPIPGGSTLVFEVELLAIKK